MLECEHECVYVWAGAFVFVCAYTCVRVRPCEFVCMRAYLCVGSNRPTRKLTNQHFGEIIILRQHIMQANVI